MFGKAQERDVIFAVMLMVLGAVIAGMNDIEFDLYGYFMVILNNVATSVYLIMIARISKKSGLSSVRIDVDERDLVWRAVVRVIFAERRYLVRLLI